MNTIKLSPHHLLDFYLYAIFGAEAGINEDGFWYFLYMCKINNHIIYDVESVWIIDFGSSKNPKQTTPFKVW